MAEPCKNPPPPDGFRIWRGAVPDPLTQWAMGLRDHVAGFSFGTTWGTTYNNEYVVARRDCHPYTWKNGKLITGLHIKGITLYSQVPPVSAVSYNPATDTLDVRTRTQPPSILRGRTGVSSLLPAAPSFWSP